MSKICGYLDFTSQPFAHAAHYLEAMIKKMKHDESQIESYQMFSSGNGGIGVLQGPFDPHPYLLHHKKPDEIVCGLAGYVTEIGGVDIRQLTEGSLCENILGHWKLKGSDFLHEINGTFSLALYDHKRESLSIAGDRYGFHPLYYYADANAFWFASEVKALLAIMQNTEPDWQGWADFFYIGHMMGTKTLVKGVHTIDSGEYIRFDKKGVKKKKYFDFTDIEPLAPDRISTDEIADRYRRAVARLAGFNKNHTVLLSGGFDSRLTLGALKACGVSPRLVSLEHEDEHQGLDGALARKLAASLGMTCEIRKSRKGYADSAHWRDVFYILDGMVPNRDLFISQVYPELDSRMGIVWDSLALDLTLGGYHGYDDVDHEKNLTRFAGERSKIRPVLQALLAPEVFHALDEGFHDRLHTSFAGIHSNHSRFIFFLIQNRVRRRTAVNPYQLYSTRVRTVSPTIDFDFLHYILAIPNNQKLHHSLYLKMMKDHFPDLLNIPACSAGEIFLGWKSPLMIARHYDWKFGARNQLSKYPGFKKGLQSIIRSINKQQNIFSKDILAGSITHYGSDKNISDLDTRQIPIGVSTVNYMNLWFDMFGS